MKPACMIAMLAMTIGAARGAEKKAAEPIQMPPGYQSVHTDTSGWFPFEFPTDDTNLDSIDLSGYLDAPAGKHGFNTARPDGHFYFEDGTRARFFGTNVGGRACTPDKDKAAAIAARLAKYGVNMLRLHSFDGQWGPIIDPRAPTSQDLVADAQDRMDFFVNELKKRGIYVYMDLLDYRQFRTADGVAHGDEFTHNWAGSMKGASIFDERMIELQKDYATKLLTHRNPYTGLRYVDEPAVGVVETTNENSVFYFFRQGDLSLPYYREELSKRWNRWLAARYGDRTKLAAAWGAAALRPDEDPAKGTVVIPFGGANQLKPDDAKAKPDPLLAKTRIGDLFRFFVEIQRHYYEVMHGHLKQIGVRVPIAGTNQSFFIADSQVEAELNEFISRNQYWNHPNVNAKPLLKFFNGPMVRADIPTVRNPISDIVGTSIEGKPQGVAEYNFPWPNEYRAEGWLMSAAYACLQDWDMFLLFSYDPAAVRLGNFTSNSDPARWGEYPAIATMFHRQDVAPGKTEVRVVHTPKDTYTPRPDGRYAKAMNERFLTFVTKTRNVYIDDAYRAKDGVVLACGDSADAKIDGKVIRLPKRPWEEWLFPKFVAQAQKLGLPGYEKMDGAAKRFDSDTGELSLDYGKGVLRIDTPRTKGAVGFLGAAGPVDEGELRIECQTPFAAITATSLDGQPLGHARRVLLTAVARAEHTGQSYWRLPDAELAKNPMSWMLPQPGSLPVLAEPVRAQVRLAVPGTAAVYPLSPAGKRLARIETKTEDGKLTIDPAAAKSIWCEVVIE